MTPKMPSPLVSVIIPTKNSERTIAACLASLQKQTYRNIECIVVDNYSSDNTASIVRAMKIPIVFKGTERSIQRNYGAAKSNGEYFLFIDSDMELERGVVAQCVRMIMGNKNFHAIVIPEQSFGIGFWATCKAYERSLYRDVPWMNAARFFKKESFLSIEGFAEDLTGSEDFDIQNKIIEHFGKASIGTISQTIRHNEGTLSLRTMWQKKYYYGTTIMRYKRKRRNIPSFHFQASLARRILIFSSKPRRIVSHPLLYMGTIFMKSIEFLAGGLGYLAGLNHDKNK